MLTTALKYTLIGVLIAYAALGYKLYYLFKGFEQASIL